MSHYYSADGNEAITKVDYKTIACEEFNKEIIKKVGGSKLLQETAL